MPIILTVLGFMWWWPVGLLILAFLIAKGKFGCWASFRLRRRWADA